MLLGGKYIKERYKRGIERACIDAIVIISDGVKAESFFIRLLAIYLKKVITKEMISVAVEHTESKKTNNTEEQYDTQINMIKALPYDTYSCFKWQILSLYFTYNGLFRLGYVCREKSADIIQNQTKPSIRKIQVLLERNLISLSERDLYYLENQKGNNILRNEIVDFHNLLDMLERKRIIRNNKFSNYLKDKSVLIIGPAKNINTVDDIPFYAEADCIVRNNYMLGNALKQIKVNLSYHNGAGVKYLIDKDEEKSLLKILDWLVVKNHEQNIGVNEDNIHRAPDVTNLMYMGYANMLPIMVFDLKVHGAKELFVCGNNLFLTKKIHSSDYVFKADANMRHSLTVHNLYAQHAFLKLLYAYGVFVPDDELKKVLDLSTEEYAKCMEQYYCI